MKSGQLHFLLSTGRVSTQSITAELSALLPDAIVEHEPIGAAYSTKNVFKNSNCYDEILKNSENLRNKIQEIEKIAASDTMYFSTGWPASTWANYFLKQYIEARFIGLVREPIAFSASLLSHYFFRGRNDEYAKNCIIDDSTINVYYESLKKNYKKFNRLEKALYHWLEMNRFIYEFCKINNFRIFNFEEIRSDKNKLTEFYCEFTKIEISKITPLNIDTMQLKKPKILSATNYELLDECISLAFKLRYNESDITDLINLRNNINFF